MSRGRSHPLGAGAARAIFGYPAAMAAVVARAPTLGLALLMLAPGAARADDRPLELGAGVSLDLLGKYDVGAHLGSAPRGNDLGPATLGGFVYGGARVGPELVVGAEAGLAIGGLVRTDERYFGGRSALGASLNVNAKLVLGWIGPREGTRRWRVGGDLGLERLVESTEAGSVTLDAAVGGPWFGVELGDHVVLQLRTDIHAPITANIGDYLTGDPGGVFYSVGVRALFVLGAGARY